MGGLREERKRERKADVKLQHIKRDKWLKNWQSSRSNSGTGRPVSILIKISSGTFCLFGGPLEKYAPFCSDRGLFINFSLAVCASHLFIHLFYHP